MAVDAACCRCHRWFELSPVGAGFARDYHGLCGKCRIEVGDLDKALEPLKRKIHGLGEDAKDWRRKYNDAVSKRDQAWNRVWGASGSAAQFFGTVATVGLAGKAFDSPEERAADGPEAKPDTSFADVAKELENVPDDNFRPENLPTAPPRNPQSPVATANPASNVNRETSLHSHIRASNAEWRAYDDAVFGQGEIPISCPGRVNEGGPDFLTAAPNAHGDMVIFVNDAKMSSTGAFPDAKAPSKWNAWLDDEVGPAVQGFSGDKSIKTELDEALAAGRVQYRQGNVDYSPSPSGQGSVEWPGDAGSAAAAEAASTIMKGLALATSLLALANTTDRFSNDIGEYYQASKETDDWQKLLDDIDKQIEDLTKQIECLQHEKQNQHRNSHP